MKISMASILVLMCNSIFSQNYDYSNEIGKVTLWGTNSDSPMYKLFIDKNFNIRMDGSDSSAAPHKIEFSEEYVVIPKSEYEQLMQKQNNQNNQVQEVNNQAKSKWQVSFDIENNSAGYIYYKCNGTIINKQVSIRCVRDGTHSTNNVDFEIKGSLDDSNTIKVKVPWKINSPDELTQISLTFLNISPYIISEIITFNGYKYDSKNCIIKKLNDF